MLWSTLRKQTGRFVVDSFFHAMSKGFALTPLASPRLNGVEVIKNIPYRAPDGPHAKTHLLDIYRPRTRLQQPLRVALYVHGGGFRILSKDSHWLMGLIFARHGYLLCNINYRLAPRHPYPAAVQDACAAYQWVTENCARFGGDLSRGWVLAGESAGANLVTALTIAACCPRSEPWARGVFDTGHTPDGVMAACGMLQTSDARRFSRRKKLPFWVADRLEEVSASYLGPQYLDRPSGEDLADPLCWFERGEQPKRPLPPFFIPVGTADPLLDDSRRFGAALQKLGVRSKNRYYPGEPHAFMALIWRRNARLCWRELFTFLDNDSSQQEL
jgi:acetyl esterase